MAKLTWDNNGERFYEVGVNNVLYMYKRKVEHIQKVLLGMGSRLLRKVRLVQKLQHYMQMISNI